jgi:hypothetical protein
LQSIALARHWQMQRVIPVIILSRILPFSFSQDGHLRYPKKNVTKTFLRVRQQDCGSKHTVLG